MPKVTFEEAAKTIEVEAGANLRKVARAHGVEIYGGPNRYINCRGFGFCGTDRVEISGDSQATSAPTWKEKLHFGANSRMRLACQTKVLGDIAVRTAPAMEYGEAMKDNLKVAGAAAVLGLLTLLAFLVMFLDWAGKPL